MEIGKVILYVLYVITALGEMVAPVWTFLHEEYHMMIASLNLGIAVVRTIVAFARLVIIGRARIRETGKFLGKGVPNQEGIDCCTRLVQCVATVVLRTLIWLYVYNSSEREKTKLWDLACLNGLFDGVLSISELVNRESAFRISDAESTLIQVSRNGEDNALLACALSRGWEINAKEDEAKIESLRDELAIAKLTIESLRERATSLQGQIYDFNAAIDSLQGQMDGLQVEVDRLQGDVREKVIIIEAIKSEMDGLRVEVDRLQGDVRKKDTIIEAIKSENETKSAELQDRLFKALDKLDNLEKKHAACQTQAGMEATETSSVQRRTKFWEQRIAAEIARAASLWQGK